MSASLLLGSSGWSRVSALNVFRSSFIAFATSGHHQATDFGPTLPDGRGIQVDAAAIIRFENSSMSMISSGGIKEIKEHLFQIILLNNICML